MQNIKYWIWLTKLSLSPEKLRKTLKKYTPAKLWSMEEKELKENFTKEEINQILNSKNRKDLNLYEQYMKEHKIELFTICDKEYPDKLKYIENAPIALYILGNKSLLKEKSIAVVGSRTCTEYGKTMSQAFSYLLAKNNITIISGLALGIDTFAHEGALLAEGKTIAVIGTGIDLVYPKENIQLMHEIIDKNGLIISEYPLGTKPSKNNFPRRNRIISAISDGVLVIEAREKSGALITVNYALEQGKEVYVVPRKYNQYYCKTGAIVC